MANEHSVSPRPSDNQARIICENSGSGWRGSQFIQLETSPEGVFDSNYQALHISRVCGPMKVRYGPPSRSFVDCPITPRLHLPGEQERGAWKGAQRGLQLIIDLVAFEQITSRPFRAYDLRDIEEVSAPIDYMMNALLIDTRGKHLNGAVMGESIIAAILHVLLRNDSNLVKTGELTQIKIKRVKDHIEYHLSSGLSLESLSAEIGVGTRHLCRMFQKETGLTPYQYVLVRRIERAKQLIQERQLSLTDIALSVGFAGQAHMATTFRKIAGVSPLQFRNSL